MNYADAIILKSSKFAENKLKDYCENTSHKVRYMTYNKCKNCNKFMCGECLSENKDKCVHCISNDFNDKVCRNCGKNIVYYLCKVCNNGYRLFCNVNCAMHRKNVCSC